MRVLFVSSEIFPMAKTGGLADVSAALPAALAAQDLDVRLVMPAYPSALRAVRGARRPRFLAEFEGLGRADVIEAVTPDSSLGIALIDSPALFERPGGPYHDERGREWRDNLKRFAMLSRAAAMLAGSGSPLDWRPEIVHLNDWQTGLTSALLLADPARPIVVFTIHNISFPGIFPMARFRLLGLPEEMRRPEGIGYHRRFSLLKAGIQYADWVTTVSPTYAHEIQTRQFGFGFETLLASRAESL